MKTGQVQDHFRKQVDNYRSLMTRIIPDYEVAQRLLIDLLPFDRTKKLRILDLGSGPGTLSELVLERYPQSEVLAFDLTQEMLDSAKFRLSRFGSRFRIFQGDYRNKELFGVGYDAILAGMTLHHLTDSERKTAFQDFFLALNPGGIFLSQDIVLDEDLFISEWHCNLWRTFMRDNGEDDSFWYKKHKEKDHPVSVERLKSWLTEAGFAHPACHWRFWNFSIISATKED
ncbi:MAG: class I SAM-dependent methyltransferase [Nitrospirae bacterium]|nr:MAG: Biotin synthesis protein/methyltransferase [Leptospirillum sp. Group IV 'UBA BS']MCL4486389.1 class I SAM-dependent methyltransferase [Nitrospirota bacterium]MCL5285524.1 class I SAM-dependent methyltransferase [Nitrospirota bacterium]